MFPFQAKLFHGNKTSFFYKNLFSPEKWENFVSQTNFQRNHQRKESTFLKSHSNETVPNTKGNLEVKQFIHFLANEADLWRIGIPKMNVLIQMNVAWKMVSRLKPMTSGTWVFSFTTRPFPGWRYRSLGIFP